MIIRRHLSVIAIGLLVLQISLCHPAIAISEEITTKHVSGNALIDAKKPMMIETMRGNLWVAKGAIAFVMTGNDSVAVFGLHTPSTESLRFISGKSVVNVKPGQMLVFTQQTGEFDSVNPAKTIPYRGLTKHEIGDGTIVWSAEYAMLSLVQAVKPLRAKLKSSDPNEKAMARQVLRNGLILNETRASAGKFKVSAR